MSQCMLDFYELSLGLLSVPVRQLRCCSAGKHNDQINIHTWIIHFQEKKVTVCCDSSVIRVIMRCYFIVPEVALLYKELTTREV